MDKDRLALDAVFFALSDPTRRDMLTRLVEDDATISEIAAHYEISLPAVSKHLVLLEKAELISVEKCGRKKIISLQPQSFERAQIWLTTLNDESTIFDSIEADIQALSDLLI